MTIATGRGPTIQLTVVDEVPLSLACQAPNFGFVIWYCFKPEVFRDWFLAVHVRAMWPDNGCEGEFQ
jgi:hypothetical protein